MLLIKPILDILECVNELHFSISEDQLVHCDTKVPTMRRLFEFLLEILGGNFETSALP